MFTHNTFILLKFMLVVIQQECKFKLQKQVIYDFLSGKLFNYSQRSLHYHLGITFQ